MQTYEERDEHRSRIGLAALGATAAASLLFAPAIARNAARGLGRLADKYIKNFVVKDQKRSFISGEGSRFASFNSDVAIALRHGQFTHELRTTLANHPNKSISDNSELIMDRMLYSDFTANVLSGVKTPFGKFGLKIPADPHTAIGELPAFKDLRVDLAARGFNQSQMQLLERAVEASRTAANQKEFALDGVKDDILLQYGRTLTKRAQSRRASTARGIGHFLGFKQESLGEFMDAQLKLPHHLRSREFKEDKGAGNLLKNVIDTVERNDGKAAADAIRNNIRGTSVFHTSSGQIDLSNVRPMYTHMADWLEKNVTIPFSPLFGSFTPFRLFPWMKSARQDFVLYHSHYKGLAMNQMLGKALGKTIGQDIAVIGGKAFGLPESEGNLVDLGVTGKNINLNSSSMQQVFYNLSGLKRTDTEGKDYTTGLLHSHLEKEGILGNVARFLKLGSQDKQSWFQQKASVLTKYQDPNHPINIFDRLHEDRPDAEVVSDMSRLMGWISSTVDVDPEYALSKLSETHKRYKAQGKDLGLSPLLMEAIDAFSSNEAYLEAARRNDSSANGHVLSNYLFDEESGLLQRIKVATLGFNQTSDLLLNSVREAAADVMQNPEIDTGTQATLSHTLLSEIMEASSGVKANVTRLDRFRMELLAEAGQQLTKSGSGLDIVFDSATGQDQAARLFGYSKGVQSRMNDQMALMGDIWGVDALDYTKLSNRAKMYRDEIITGKKSSDIYDLFAQKAGRAATWNELEDPSTAPFMFVQDYKSKGVSRLAERVKGFFSTDTQDLRPDSLGAYFMASKLNEMLDAYGLGLPQEAMKSTSEVYKNLLLYRALPVLAGVEAYKQGGWLLNSVGVNVPSIISAPIIQTQLAATRIEDALGITKMKKDLVNSIPGMDTMFTPRDADELEYHYDYGFDTVRRGRFWLMASKSPFMGESVEGYVPTWNRQASSFWQSAKNVEMQGFQSLIHSPILNPIGAVLDKDWWMRRHEKDRPYPMGKSIITPHNSLLTLAATVDPTVLIDKPDLHGLPTKGEAFSALALRTMGDTDLTPLAEKQLSVDNDFNINMGYPGRELSYIERLRQSYSDKPYAGGAKGFESRSIMGNLFSTKPLNLPTQHYKKGASRMGSPGYGYVMGSGGFLGAMGNLLGYGGTPNEGGTYNLNTGRRKYREEMQTMNEAAAAGLPMGESQLKTFEITNPKSVRSGIARSVSAQNELYGLYGWMRDAAAENLPIPGSDNPKISYDTPDWALSTSRQFWEKRLGGLDPIPVLGELNELARRVLTRRSSSDIRFNPIPNNMPAWIPGDDSGGVNYHIGDPYTKTLQGEMRLPGEAYRRLNPKRFEKPLLTMRASMLGHDTDEMIRYYFGEKSLEGDVGGYASAKGTQLHKQIQAGFKATGMLEEEERYIYDKKHDISGHIDMVLKDLEGNQVIGEIKTMGEAKFRSGKVAKAGVSQLQQYMYTTGIHRGFLLYVNQSNPAEMREIPVAYDRLSLARDHARLSGVRAKLNREMKKGNINEGNFYPDLVKFEMLSDIAAFSPQWENLKTVIEQDEQLSTTDHYRFKEALKMAHEKRKRFNLYPYRYGSEEVKTARVDSISKEGLIYLEGQQSPIKMAGIDLIQSKVNSGHSGSMIDNLMSAFGLNQGTTPEERWVKRKVQHLSWHLLGLNLNMADGQKGTSALLSAYGIKEGGNVTYKTNGTSDDSGKPVSAIVSSFGHSNVGKSILSRGFATVDQTDDSPEAWKTRNDRLPGFLANPLEHLAHTDNIINNKLLHTRTALEEWKRAHIFGTSSSSWEHPFRSFVFPTFTALGNKDPLSAFVQGGLFTSLFMKQGNLAGKGKELLGLGRDTLKETRDKVSYSSPYSAMNNSRTAGEEVLRESQSIRDNITKSVSKSLGYASRHLNKFIIPNIMKAARGLNKVYGDLKPALGHFYNSALQVGVGMGEIAGPAADLGRTFIEGMTGTFSGDVSARNYRLSAQKLAQGMSSAVNEWKAAGSEFRAGTDIVAKADYSPVTKPIGTLARRALKDIRGVVVDAGKYSFNLAKGILNKGVEGLDSRMGPNAPSALRNAVNFAKKGLEGSEIVFPKGSQKIIKSFEGIQKALTTESSKKLLAAFKDTAKNKKYAAFLYGGAVFAGVSIGSHIIHPTEAGRVPLRTRRRWAIDEYYDTLKYVKYRGMFLKTAEEAKKYEGIDVEQVATELERRKAKSQDESISTMLRARKKAARIKHGMFESPFHVIGAHLRPLVDPAVRYWDDYAAKAENTFMRKPANFMSNLMHQTFATYEERMSMRQRDAENVVQGAENKVKRLQDSTHILMDFGPYAQRALYARHKYQETAYGTEQGNLQQALGTVSSNVRQIYADVTATGSPKEKKEFYNLLPKYQKRLFQPYLSPRSKTIHRESLSHVFHKYQLPDADWKGWDPGVDIDLLKARTYEAEGLDAIDAGVYPAETKKAKVITRGIPLPIVRANTVGGINIKLRAIAGGMSADRYDTSTSIVSSTRGGTSRLSLNMQQDVGGQISSMISAVNF